MITFTSPTAEDIAELAATMRQADRAECEATGHTDLVTALERAVRVSVWCHTARVNGVLACMFGVHPLSGGLLSDTGVPWLIGTEEMLRRRRAFLRLSPLYIAQMQAVYPTLMNLVHARNVKACAWLRHAGFTLSEAKPHGPLGEPFRLFTLGASNV